MSESSGPKIPLWTIQRRGFELTEGRYDRNQSRYADNPGLMKAYEKLFNQLGCDQFLWCSVVPPNAEDKRRAARGDDVIVSLKVPYSRLRYVDHVMWILIIEPDPHERWLPTAVINQLREQAHSASAGGKGGSVEACYKQLVEKFWRDYCNGDPFDSLIISASTLDERTVAHCPFPLEQDWIVGVFPREASNL